MLRDRWRTWDGLVFRVVSSGGRVPLALEELDGETIAWVVNVSGAELRACFSGPWIDRAAAVAALDHPEPFRSIFGQSYDRVRVGPRKGAGAGSLYQYGARLRRIGLRLTDERVRAIFRKSEDSLEVLLEAAKEVTWERQVERAILVRKLSPCRARPAR